MDIFVFWFELQIFLRWICEDFEVEVYDNGKFYKFQLVHNALYGHALNITYESFVNLSPGIETFLFIAGKYFKTVHCSNNH